MNLFYAALFLTYHL